MSDKVILIYDEAMTAHDPGPGHPERPGRLRAIVEELRRSKIDGANFIQPKFLRKAERHQIERIHDPRYVDCIDALQGRSAQLDADTAVSPGSVEAAWCATGAAIQAVNAVMEASEEGQSIHSAFALVRPPGHHAERSRAMGFCLFNNIAIAAAHAIAEHSVQRVLIVDWDVHHGNGTQQAFYERSDVLVFDSHQDRLFPNSGDADEAGRGEGEGYTVNLPLPPGMDDAAYIELYRRLLIPIADQYKPELVLVSAGFDAHRDDPLAGMSLTENGFANLCAMVRDIADRHASGRLALVLEGGYNLAALAGSVRACVEVLAGAQPPAPVAQSVSELAIKTIESLQAAHGRFWRL